MQLSVCRIVADYVVVVDDLLKVRMSLGDVLPFREPHALIGLAVEVKMAVDVRKVVVIVAVQIDFSDGVVRNTGYKKGRSIALMKSDQCFGLARSGEEDLCRG